MITLISSAWFLFCPDISIKTRRDLTPNDYRVFRNVAIGCTKRGFQCVKFIEVDFRNIPHNYKVICGNKLKRT